MDSRGDAMEEEEKSDEFLLLEKYCAQQELRKRQGPPEQGSRLIVYSSPETKIYGHSLTGVVNRLADIAASVPIAEDDLKTDSIPDPQQELVEKLVSFLKKKGDDFDEKILQDKVLQQQLQGAFSYSLFENVMAALQGAVGATAALRASAGTAASKKETRLQGEQIARTCEVTRRLSAIDQIPKRQALLYGSRFLRRHHSEWVQQHGGWDKAFLGDEID